MGGKTLHWEVPEGVSPSDFELDNGEEPMEKSRWGLEVPPIGESNVVSVLGGYGNLHL